MKEIERLFLLLHWVVEECVAGRISVEDLDGSRDQIFTEYRKVPWYDET